MFFKEVEVLQDDSYCNFFTANLIDENVCVLKTAKIAFDKSVSFIKLLLNLYYFL